MNMFAARPWGPVTWMLDKLPNRSWSLLGCLGPEERSLGIWQLLKTRGATAESAFIRIEPVGTRFHSEYHIEIGHRTNELNLMGPPSAGVWGSELFASAADIVSLADRFVGECGSHVILDISTFPKRFFFPIVKRLLLSGRIETLLVTYTLPVRYGQSLAEDHRPFANLPLFGPSKHPEPKTEVFVMSAGFMKLGISELLDPYKQVDVRTILPFPPGMPTFARNWEFIRAMKEVLPESFKSPVRISAYDCSDTFAHLKEMTDNGRLNAILAPYGPKPMSLAFCLFANLTQSVVYYTQPNVYNPRYSEGIAAWQGALASYCYCLRLHGRDLYTL